MNSHRQVVWDLYNARSSGDPEHLDMAERQLHEHIEAGEAHKLFSIGCDGETQADDPVLNDIYQEIDRASRVEGMRGASSADLHDTITDANERLSKGNLEREDFNDAIQERNAAVLVMRERADADRDQFLKPRTREYDGLGL